MCAVACSAIWVDLQISQLSRDIKSLRPYLGGMCTHENLGLRLTRLYYWGESEHDCIAHVCVYACLRPYMYTVNFKWACLNFNIMKIELYSLEALLLECSIGYLESRWLKLKYTWQLTPCLLQIIDSRLPTGSTNSITMVVEVTSGKSHATALINVRTSARDLSTSEL